MAPRKAKQSASSKEPPKKRIASNGYKLPDPIEPGEILVDMVKNKWRIGKSIGQGGFGEIYLASDNIEKNVDDSADYVVKIEPHSNGPLFTEMHCYMRIGKPDLIESWMKEKKLKTLGMPKFLGSGSVVYKGQKYRFMVMERFGSDLQKILNNHNKKLSFKTVYIAAIQILDVLEYIHSREYIHADIKASNLLLGHQPGTHNQLFLVDYGLACRYANDGVHKPYRYDGRKAHDGTIEFTSRDAHIGAHSRRGDLEILGYNLVQWLCCKLPWEDNLQDCNYVAEQKRGYMEDVDKFIKTCFPDTEPPGLKKYLKYVQNLTFDDCPDYEHCRQILRDGLKAKGYKDDGILIINAATPLPRKPQSKVANRKKGIKRRSEEEENLSGLAPAKHLRNDERFPCKPRNIINRVNTRLCHRNSDIGISLSKPSQPEFYLDPDELIVIRENQKMLDRKKNQRPKRIQIKKDTSLDNPTPQMLAIMAKIREKNASPICTKKHKHNSQCSGHRPIKQSNSYDESPSEYTPEMEAVMKRMQERLLSDSEGYSSSGSSTSSEATIYSVFQPSNYGGDSSDNYYSEDSNDSLMFAKYQRRQLSKRDHSRDSRSSRSSVSSKQTSSYQYGMAIKRSSRIAMQNKMKTRSANRQTSRVSTPDFL